MAAHPVLVLCEGSHDIAFLTRLLAVAVGAELVDLPVNKLPEPFGRFFLSRLEGRSANQAKLGGFGPVAPDEPPLLDAVCEMPDKSRLWYFMNCCGDSRANQINSFLKPVIARTQVDDPSIRLNEVGIVFVNDADNKGIEGRQKLITDNHAPMLAPLMPDFAAAAANTPYRKDGYGVGTCIFTAPGSSKGALEDVVWALWAEAHADRRDKSRALMDLLAVAGTKIGPGSTPCKILKAALTAAGQTECPGYSLAVVLRDTNAIDADAMRSDHACNAILKVLMDV